MKKNYLLFLALFIFWGGENLFATTTYLNSLNIPVWATNDDYIAQSLFPQLMPYFSKRFVIEYSRTSIWGYSYFPVYNGTATLIMNRPYTGNIASNTNVFGLGYSMNIGSLGKGGLLFTFGRDSNDITSLPTEQPKTEGGSESYRSTGIIGITGGISLKFKGKPVDIGLTLNFPYETRSDITKEPGGHTIESSLDEKDSYGFALHGRTLFNKIKFYSILSYNYSGSSNDDKRWGGPTYDLLRQNNLTETDHRIDIAGGASYPISPANGILIRGGALFDIGYDNYTSTLHVYTRDVSNTTITPRDEWSLDFSLDAFFNGVINIYKGWYFLGGIRKTIVYSYTKTSSLNANNKITDASYTSTFTSQPTSLAMGVRGKIGIVKVDFTLSTNTFLNGTYILSGIPGSLFTRLAISVLW